VPLWFQLVAGGMTHIEDMNGVIADGKEYPVLMGRLPDLP
jgi:hypothetical protein